MTFRELREILLEKYGDCGIILLEPEYYDKAIVGNDDYGRVIYSYDKLVETLVEHDRMSEEEAMEWLDYNTLRAIPSMGMMAPIVMYPIEYNIED